MVSRSGRTWKSRMGVCGVAFAVTGVIVYAVGVASTSTPQTACTARATICYQGPAPGATDGSSRSAVPDAQAIRDQIVTEANLRWAMSPSAPDAAASGEALAWVRQNLDVSVGNTATPGELEVSIALTGPDAREAAELVDRLAERWAQQQRERGAAAARDACVQARHAAEQARRQWLEAKAQRDAFLQHYFEQLVAEAKPAPAVRPKAPEPARGPAENPEWLELNGQVEELRRQHSALLAERTPLHPSVRKIDAQIADLQQRLRAVPREAADRGPELPSVLPPPPDQTLISPLPPTEAQLDEPPIEPAPVVTHPGPTGRRRPVHGGVSEPGVLLPPAGATLQQRRAAMQGFSEHTEAVDRAWQQYEGLAGAERRAWGMRLRAAQIDLKLAGQCEMAPASQRSRWPLVALLAGLAAAATIGVMSLGGRGDRPLASVAEVQASLPVPILGTIPSARSTSGACREPDAGQ